MFNDVRALKLLKINYPEIDIYPSGFTAKLKMTDCTEVIIDPQKPCQIWISVDLNKGIIVPVKDAAISTENRLFIMELNDDLQRIYTECEEAAK